MPIPVVELATAALNITAAAREAMALKEAVADKLKETSLKDQLDTIKGNSLESLAARNHASLRRLNDEGRHMAVTLSSADLRDVGRQYNNEVRSKSAAGEVRSTNVSDWRPISNEELKASRTEFNQNKRQLLTAWEQENGKPWPTYANDVVTADGRKIRQSGDRYDAHHVQPLAFGGENKAPNITPMHATDHYDKQGIHGAAGPYNALAGHFRNA
jgi:hypothetical protein